MKVVPIVIDFEDGSRVYALGFRGRVPNPRVQVKAMGDAGTTFEVSDDTPARDLLTWVESFGEELM